MRSFDIPGHYRSPLISAIKNNRKQEDPRKKDFTPTLLDFNSVRFILPRHFGFCYGVENAIEMAFKTIETHPDKRIFLLSEMIHNPNVNANLQEQGVRFLMDTKGNQLIDWENLNANDIVMVPAFGTTLEIEKRLNAIGVSITEYDTTCPFVEKVWNRAEKLSKGDFTIIVHGKPTHEETRATFSHSAAHSPTLVVKNMEETQILGDIVLGKRPKTDFERYFGDRHSEGFSVEEDLNKIAVVNQTTMLASDTQGIANYLKEIMIQKFGEENYREHFGDTRDTLCYATLDNQRATFGVLEQEADLALVVGGYNSSNTSHLVELCEEQLPTYFINTAACIESRELIKHFDIHVQQEVSTEHFLPTKRPLTIILTSGASCPDGLLQDVIERMLDLMGEKRNVEDVMHAFA